jgi:hypothetical protein
LASTNTSTYALTETSKTSAYACSQTANACPHSGGNISNTFSNPTNGIAHSLTYIAEGIWDARIVAKKPTSSVAQTSTYGDVAKTTPKGWFVIPSVWRRRLLSVSTLATALVASAPLVATLISALVATFAFATFCHSVFPTVFLCDKLEWIRSPLKATTMSPRTQMMSVARRLTKTRVLSMILPLS